ncbi:MAG: 50S ribosomal protein L6 [Bdellovibrionota bacterium]|nr:50S ribosomal protein L6 [Deltaproteobacteria bacterium]
MSRIGKQPITIPSGVSVDVQMPVVKVSGPKGNLEHVVDSSVVVTKDDTSITCAIAEGVIDRSKFGLTRTIIANMVHGCAEGFKKNLEVNGVGYRAAVKGQEIELSLGFSHVVNHPIPDGIMIQVDGKTNAITIEGADKQLVGQVAAEIRSYRTPEPYKGKGVKYDYERIRRKAGKSAG